MSSKNDFQYITAGQIQTKYKLTSKELNGAKIKCHIKERPGDIRPSYNKIKKYLISDNEVTVK